jgi:hypothetical protein
MNFPHHFLLRYFLTSSFRYGIKKPTGTPGVCSVRGSLCTFDKLTTRWIYCPCFQLVTIMDDQDDVDLWYQNSMYLQVHRLSHQVWSNRLLHYILVSLETVSFLILLSFLLHRMLVRDNTKKGGTSATDVIVVLDNGSGMFKGEASVAASWFRLVCPQ